MAHLIIDGIDKVFTPQGEMWEKTWHSLQTAVVGGIDLNGANVREVFCPIVECGVKPDFDAEISNVPEELAEAMDISGWKMILADCREGVSKSVIPLHVPKKGYKIHQNKALFDCMIAAAREVLGDGGFEIVTLGTLGGYSQFFMSIAIKGQDRFCVGKLPNGANDTWKQFFNLNSSHNGLIGSNVMLSFIRQVCFNTVQASISDAESNGTTSAIKHTLNSEALLTPAQFASDLQAWLKQGENFRSKMLAIKAESMTVDQFKSFAAGVFTNAASDELSTNSFNRIEEMTAMFSKGLGNVGSTRYDAVNAFTEYFTSGSGVGNPKNVQANKRAAMANFGRGNDWKLEAIKIATDENLFASCLQHGQTLYSDKAKVVAMAN